MADVHALRRLTEPPFTLRARLLTPLSGGGTHYESDALVQIDAAGRLGRIRRVDELLAGGASDTLAGQNLVDVRPAVVLPGLVDLHAHLPQLANAGLGAGLDLLNWLQRYIFPLERGFDRRAAEAMTPAALRAFAAAGSTTIVLYGAVYEDSIDAAFQAAESHGIRAVIGKVMMDRLRYDETVEDREVLEISLRQSVDLIARWHGRADGRLLYAVTPRFAVSCTADMLRLAAELAASTGTYLQTHLAEDRAEIAEVRRLFPEARDYTDVYDRAGALGAHSIMGHAIHLSQREISRLVESGTHVAHCPSSNLFLASGTMPLARYLAAGMSVGLGSDVAAGPELSLFAVMRAGAYTQSGMRTMLGEQAPVLGPLDWLRLGTLEGARVLGLERQIGSLEEGKEADFILVDPRVCAPLPEEPSEEPDEIVSRLIFRSRPEMVLGAWVRGRRLAAD